MPIIVIIIMDKYLLQFRKKEHQKAQFVQCRNCEWTQHGPCAGETKPLARTGVACWIVPVSKGSQTENWKTQCICVSVSDPLCLLVCRGALEKCCEPPELQCAGERGGKTWNPGESPRRTPGMEQKHIHGIRPLGPRHKLHTPSITTQQAPTWS